MSIIIGVAGFISSGKSTVGDYLVEQHGFGRESFARPLKDTASAIFNWPRHLLEGDTKESREWREQPDIWWESELNWKEHKFSSQFPRFTPRVCLQLFGTNVMRHSFHDQIWIASLRNRVQQITTNTIITDCRFPNELKAIKDENGLIIRTRRGPEPNWYEIAKQANFNQSSKAQECYHQMLTTGIHVSEWAWIGIDFDFVLDNNGTFEQLYQSVDQILENYNGF